MVSYFIYTREFRINTPILHSLKQMILFFLSSVFSLELCELHMIVLGTIPGAVLGGCHITVLEITLRVAVF